MSRNGGMAVHKRRPEKPEWSICHLANGCNPNYKWAATDEEITCQKCLKRMTVIEARERFENAKKELGI